MQPFRRDRSRPNAAKNWSKRRLDRSKVVPNPDYVKPEREEFAGSPSARPSKKYEMDAEQFVYADYPDFEEEEEEVAMEPIDSRGDGSTYSGQIGYQLAHNSRTQDRDSLQRMGVDVAEADRIRAREKKGYSPSVEDYLRNGRPRMATPAAETVRMEEAASLEGSPMQASMAPFGYAARGATPAQEGAILGDALPEVLPEGLMAQVEAKRAMMGLKSGGVPAVGMAQRLKYKISKKVQGLVSEYTRLKFKPSPRELAITVHPKNGVRQSLRDNRIEACMREMANLKADVDADGLGRFLSGTELSRQHYLSNGVAPASLNWFVNNVKPSLSHYERTGMTQQYAGGSRQGYRYAK